MRTRDKLFCLFVAICGGIGIGLAEKSLGLGIIAFSSILSMFILMGITT